jgi:short-subunit dehydrogenase
MKKAIIIGATSGIGKSLSELLIREGYEVGVTGRREELFQSIKIKDTSRIFFKKMDVQDLSILEPICNELVGEIGGLGLLIISAGIGERIKI